MVIYEALSGRAPYSQFNHYIVIRKVMDGEQPEGAEGVLFTDDLWRIAQSVLGNSTRKSAQCCGGARVLGAGFKGSRTTLCADGRG